MSFKFMTPVKGGGYAASGTKLDWVQRSYISDEDAVMATTGGNISRKNDLSFDGVNSEAFLDDILTTDPSPRSPMASRNGNRIAYGFIPFILENGYDSLIYDLGFRFYDDPTDQVAETIMQGGGYTQKRFADQLSPASSVRVNASSGDGLLAPFSTDSVGLFVIGVMGAADWNGGSGAQADKLKTLSDTDYWVKYAMSGAYAGGSLNDQGYGTLAVNSGRVVLHPQAYQDAQTWWRQGSSFQSIENENGMTIEGYAVKHWNDGGYRCRTYGARSIITKGVEISYPSAAIQVPSHGVIWGYITVTVADEKTRASEVASDGAAYRAETHGKWLAQQLSQATGIFSTGVIEPWNSTGGAAIPSRVWRYGLHMVGKKV